MPRSRVPAWAIIVAALVAVVLVRQAVVALRDRSDERASADATTNDLDLTSDRYKRPVIIGRIQNPAVTESSGLEASSMNAGVLWTHNDSGDDPLIYCITLRGGACGTWTLSGAEAFDWEDIAIGPGPRAGTDYLYVGDIGDNNRERDAVTIYRTPEPTVEGSDGGTELSAEVIELRYPDGPHDAETLMVHPDSGDLYVVTKEFSSSSMVFKASAPVTGGETLEAVGRIRISGFLSDRTGGDISPNGTRVVLCTYGAAYEIAVPKGAPFDDIWNQPVTEIDIGAREQGEAITYSADGESLFATSEGAKSPLYEIVLRER